MSATASSWTERIVLGPCVSMNYSFSVREYAASHPDTNSPRRARRFMAQSKQTGEQRAELEVSLSEIVKESPHSLRSYGLVNTLPAEAGSFPSTSFRPNEGLRVSALTHCEAGATMDWIPMLSIPRAVTLMTVCLGELVPACSVNSATSLAGEKLKNKARFIPALNGWVFSRPRIKREGSSYVITDYLMMHDCERQYAVASMPSGDFFVFAKQSLEELSRYHQLGLVHQNIALGSMQFDPNTRQLKIFNFGKASLGKGNHTDDLESLGKVLFSLYTGKMQPTVPWEEKIYTAARKRGAPREEADDVVALLRPLLHASRLSAEEILTLPCLQCVTDFRLSMSPLGQGRRLSLFDPHSSKCLFAIDLQSAKAPGCYHMVKTRGNRYIAVLEDAQGNDLQIVPIELRSGDALSLPDESKGSARDSLRSPWSGRIALGSELLKHGTTKICEANNPNTGSPKAIKCWDQMARALREAQVAKYVRDDPHSLSSYGLMMSNGIPGLILDRLSTPDCEVAYLKKKRSMSSPDFFVLAKQALEELARYHQKGIIHQDVKPGNMQFDESTKQLKFFDFGLSIKGGLPLRRGTSQYMAPELILGKSAYESIDVWGLGCTLFALYTGREFVPADALCIGLSMCSKFCGILDSYSSRIGAPSDEFLSSGSNVEDFYIRYPTEWGSGHDLRFRTRLAILSWQEEIQQAAERRGAPQEAKLVIELLAPMLKYKDRISAKEALKLPCLQGVADFSLNVSEGFGGGKRLRLFDLNSNACLIEIDLSKKRNLPGCYHIATTQDHQYRLVIEDEEGAVLYDNGIELLSGGVLSLPAFNSGRL